MPKGIYSRKARGLKQYPPDLVDAVRQRYESGMTQHEIAAELNTTQKIVFNVMKRHDIEPRPAVSRNQRLENNNGWKGQTASYTAFHFRVEHVLGKPKRCEVCGLSDETKRYEWANLTGKYEDIRDYKRMCLPCHRAYDKKRRTETGERTSPRHKKEVKNA